MEKYDPHRTPDPKEWKALKDNERAFLIEQYHKNARIDVPHHELHASVHTMVENQVALGDKAPVADTVDRLMSEGLDRHDAIHAVGAVLTEYLTEMLSSEPTQDLGPSRYFSRLSELTADEWQRMSEEG